MTDTTTNYREMTDEQLADALATAKQTHTWSAKHMAALTELAGEEAPYRSEHAALWTADQLRERHELHARHTRNLQALTDENDRREAKRQLDAHIAHTLTAARNLLIERGHRRAAREVERALEEEGVVSEGDTDDAWDAHDRAERSASGPANGTTPGQQEGEEATAGAGL